MSPCPIALLLTTLDERMRLPLTRWLRVSEFVEGVYRISLSAADWKALCAGGVGSTLRKRLITSLELYNPKVVAILGHERVGDKEE